MAQLVLDLMNNVGLWSALAPDGVTPSAELTIAGDQALFSVGTDNASGRVTASANALNHTLRRSLTALDLSDYDEIRLWMYSNRTADGSAGQPFFLEARLGSAAMGLTDPANTWYRYLPLSQVNTWELVRLSIDNLPAPVRGAVTLIQLRCVSASAAFACNLDNILAVREQMIGDVDAALLTQLNGATTVNGTAVPAIFNIDESAAPPSPPYIRITNYDVRLADERTTFSRVRGDFTATGFRLRPVTVGYDLYYQIDAVSDTRPHQAQLLEFVLRTLSPRGQLLVNGMQRPILWVGIEDIDVLSRQRSDQTAIHFRVMTGQEIGPSEPAIPPFGAVLIETDQPAI